MAGRGDSLDIDWYKPWDCPYCGVEHAPIRLCPAPTAAELSEAARSDR